MADVFVSYAREDLPFVHRLTAGLRARDRKVWVDLEEIIPAARWMQEIRAGITEADAVAFVITPDWVASKICQAELRYATEMSKRLVPILARETPSADVPAVLAELNWLPLPDDGDFDAGIDRLIEVLDTDIDRVHLHTRLLARAREWETRDRDRSLLLRGVELKDAETWLANQTGRDPAATPAHGQLILASRRAATGRQRGFGIAGVTVVVAMAILAAVALIQRQRADTQHAFALSRQLAAQSLSISSASPVTARRLAAAAWRIVPTNEARNSMITLLGQQRGVLLAHTDVVRAVAFSPNGKLLAPAPARTRRCGCGIQSPASPWAPP